MRSVTCSLADVLGPAVPLSGPVLFEAVHGR